LRVYREVEELNLHLEEKVKERTRELQQSLEQIQKLKEQQDGDYFLTSLLIKPLMIESIHSEVIAIQSFIKEKKEFQFRNWKREIGGDINIVQDITLKNKPYVFIFNGDAMGKSLQGAGGALVAGVIIKAILTRTLLYPEYQNSFPEKWLKELNMFSNRGYTTGMYFGPHSDDGYQHHGRSRNTLELGLAGVVQQVDDDGVWLLARDKIYINDSIVFLRNGLEEEIFTIKEIRTSNKSMELLKNAEIAKLILDKPIPNVQPLDIARKIKEPILQK